MLRPLTKKVVTSDCRRSHRAPRVNVDRLGSEVPPKLRVGSQTLLFRSKSTRVVSSLNPHPCGGEKRSGFSPKKRESAADVGDFRESALPSAPIQLARETQKRPRLSSWLPRTCAMWNAFWQCNYNWDLPGGGQPPY